MDALQTVVAKLDSGAAITDADLNTLTSGEDRQLFLAVVEAKTASVDASMAATLLAIAKPMAAHQALRDAATRLERALVYVNQVLDAR